MTLAILRILTAAIALSFLLPAQQKPIRRPWRIKGQLTEACTCNVPCSCNFGDKPSPYEFCHAMWSYWVEEGNWDKVTLDGMRIGGVDGPVGVLGLLDARATPAQRPAMENIWHVLSGRLFCLMRVWPFKAGSDEPARQRSIIRTRYAGRQFLGFEYVAIEQVITDRSARLDFAGKGGFEANYIFGRDPDKPITVANIVSWPVPVSIKGKTVYLKYGDKFNQLDYQGTNANQGRFDLFHTQSAAPPMTPPN